MKKVQKQKESENGQKKKNELTKKEQEVCEEFSKCRIRYGMTQEEWARAIGISHGLVKRIESHTISCSKKTMTKVRQYMDSCDVCPDIPDLHDLEHHILYYIFLTHMERLPKKEAAEYAGQCARSLRDTLLHMSECTTAGKQKNIYKLMDMYLKALSRVVSSTNVADVEMNFPDITNELASLTEKKIKKTASPADTDIPASSNQFGQMCLGDLQL